MIKLFFPVAKHSTIRSILSIVVTHEWKMRQVDVNYAFLHRKLTESVFMEQSSSFIDDRIPNYVCRLDKSPCSLKQAQHVWYELRTLLVSVGFVHSQSVVLLFMLWFMSMILLSWKRF